MKRLSDNQKHANKTGQNKDNKTEINSRQVVVAIVFFIMFLFLETKPIIPCLLVFICYR